MFFVLDDLVFQIREKRVDGVGKTKNQTCNQDDEDRIYEFCHLYRRNNKLIFYSARAAGRFLKKKKVFDHKG